MIQSKTKYKLMTLLTVTQLWSNISPGVLWYLVSYRQLHFLHPSVITWLRIATLQKMHNKLYLSQNLNPSLTSLWMNAELIFNLSLSLQTQSESTLDQWCFFFFLHRYSFCFLSSFLPYFLPSLLPSFLPWKIFSWICNLSIVTKGLVALWLNKIIGKWDEFESHWELNLYFNPASTVCCYHRMITRVSRDKTKKELNIKKMQEGISKTPGSGGTI